MCVGVCALGWRLYTTNEQFSHEQQGGILDEYFSLGSAVFIIFLSMNMYFSGNLKLKKMFLKAPAHLPPDRWEAAQAQRKTIALKF